MYDDFYSALENGRIEPTTFWESHVSKWDEMKQTRFCIWLLGIATKEEREGHRGSDLHRYALHLYDSLSRECNYQRQREQELQASSMDADGIKQHEIPIELQSEMAKRLLRWLVESGFLTESYLTTDKLKPKRKLAYLCYKMSKALNLGKNSRGNNQKDISWKPFERLFNTTGLGNNYNQLLREHNYDIKGLYPDIDDFFD